MSTSSQPPALQRLFDCASTRLRQHFDGTSAMLRFALPLSSPSFTFRRPHVLRSLMNNPVFDACSVLSFAFVLLIFRVGVVARVDAEDDALVHRGVADGRGAEGPAGRAGRQAIPHEPRALQQDGGLLDQDLRHSCAGTAEGMIRALCIRWRFGVGVGVVRCDRRCLLCTHACARSCVCVHSFHCIALLQPVCVPARVRGVVVGARSTLHCIALQRATTTTTTCLLACHFMPTSRCMCVCVCVFVCSFAVVAAPYPTTRVVVSSDVVAVLCCAESDAGDGEVDGDGVFQRAVEARSGRVRGGRGGRRVEAPRVKLKPKTKLN